MASYRRFLARIDLPFRSSIVTTKKKETGREFFTVTTFGMRHTTLPTAQQRLIY